MEMPPIDHLRRFSGTDNDPEGEVRMLGQTMKMMALMLLVGLVAAGLLAYQYLKPTAAASEPIQAIGLISTAAGEVAAPTVFLIDQNASQARYIIDEILQGAPKTVVGQTDQIAGQLALDFANANQATLGPIRINARTLATDSQQRDRAVQNRILLTNEYEYITFTPTSVQGLPDIVSIGHAATFQVVGDLTIRDMSRPATFEVTLTPLADDRLAGRATSTIAFADWGIAVPNVPMVTGVAEQVRLEIDFEASTV